MLYQRLAFINQHIWSWDDSTPKKKGWWKRLHELGAKQGLERLSFETPHLQIIGTSSNELIHGNFPLGGDDLWSENLASAIAGWSGSPSSPPAPSTPSRPGLPRRFRVTASSGLRVRKGPGTDFDIVTELRLGEIVYVSSTEQGWAKVDINGDGDAEGFASASYLVDADT